MRVPFYTPISDTECPVAPYSHQYLVWSVFLFVCLPTYSIKSIMLSKCDFTLNSLMANDGKKFSYAFWTLHYF